MRCISIINFKGGVGKSSLATNLGHLLTLHGYQVLLIDCDLQANSSSLLTASDPPTLTHFLQGQASLNAVVRAARKGLYVIPADRDLNLAAAHIHARRSAYYTLRDAVWQIRGCDFVLFDHAPGYTPVTEAALLASREILIPCELEPFAVQGLFPMFHKLDQTLSDHQLPSFGPKQPQLNSGSFAGTRQKRRSPDRLKSRKSLSLLKEVSPCIRITLISANGNGMIALMRAYVS